MNSNPSNETAFSLEAISEVIEHLGYSRHSRNMAYLIALFSHTGQEDGYSSSPVNPDLLIQAIWNTTDPDLLRSRRKNLSTIRNSINRDLATLFDEGRNPEGVTISPEHALVVSQEAKEALYAPFADILKPSNLPEIEKAGALLEALAEMAEKEGKPLEGSEDLAEKLKRAVQALEKGGVPTSDEHEKEIEEDAPEEDLKTVDEDEAIEEIEDDELKEVPDELEEDLDTVVEDEAVEEIEDDEFEEILDEPEEELETTFEDDAFEVIEDDELEEVLDEPEEGLETVVEDEAVEEELETVEVDDTLEEAEVDEFEEVIDESEDELETAFEEIEDDELEEVLDEPEDELETAFEDDAFEEVEDDEFEEVLDEPEDELETAFEDDAFEEIEDDELEEILDEPEDELETAFEDDAFEEIEDDEFEEVLDESDEELETVEEEHPPAPPWAADEDPDAMGERADRFETLLNESERYYNRYIHIPDGRYPTIDPVTGEETEAEIEAFLAGKYPITNALFEVFISRTGYKTTAEERGFGAVYEPRLSRQPNGKGISLSTSRGLRLIRGASWHKPSGTRSSVHTCAHHPVVQVSYEDAMAFASWTGKRLPTLAQWLASGGKSSSPYPWGDAWESHLCNTEEVGAGGTLPVDTFPNGASPFGVYDLMGNAMEWVSDLLPEKGGEPVKIAAGGSFLSDRTLTRQHTHIFDTRFSSNILGFRCIGW